MKKLVRYMNWELKNEFLASGYFATMLIMYCIIELLLSVKSIDIFIVLEMFIVNYILSTIHKIFFNEEKSYSKRSFILRAFLLSFISIVIIVVASILGGWFHGMPLWTVITIYLVLILTYLTVWIFARLGQKYDTQKLNEQLKNYKTHIKEKQEL